MSCINVKNEAGENDPRFHDMLKIHEGNEEAALNDFVRTYFLGENSSKFQIASDMYENTDEFLAGIFSVDDKFTDKEANNLRANKEFLFRKVFRNETFVGEMTDAYGKTIEFPLSETDKKITEYINQKKELSGKLMESLFDILASKDIKFISKFAAVVRKVFPRIDTNVIYQSLVRDLNINKIKAYEEFASKPFFVPSLVGENIMVHEHEVNGIKEYTIVLPTTEDGKKGFSGSEIYSFMTSIFGDYKIAQKRGFTIKNSIAGRKQLMGSIVAMAIKASNPDAKINGIRFVSLNGTGSTYDLDLYEGVKNLRALARETKTKNLLPKELLDVIEDSKDVDLESFHPSYADLLFRNLDSAKTKGNRIYMPLYDALAGDDVHDKLKAIDARINYIVSTYTSTDGSGKIAYENFDSPIGKEMVLLAKTKEQLMQHSGLDRQSYNTDKSLNWFDAWRKSLGDMQNAQMNLLFNQFKSLMFGVKQRFMKFMDEKNAVVKDFMDAYEADRGVSIKSRALNYTQEAYENLYEEMEVRELVKGQLSTEKVKVKTMRFKDPNDTTNGLKDYERKFIRESVRLHKESIIRFIGKRIINNHIKGYKNAEEWYEKEFKAYELNLPVTRKNSSDFFAEGSIRSAMSSISHEATDFLELKPGDIQRERSERPFGSATAQMKGVYGSKGRILSMGLDHVNGELVLRDRKQNNQINLDVEQILHGSVFHNYKFENEDMLKATYAAARIILLKNQFDSGKSRKNEIDTMDVLFDNLVYNERVDMSIGEFNVTRHLDWLRKTSGMATLMINYKSAGLATLGNFMALYSNALSSRFGQHYFNGSDITKAIGFSMVNPGKFGDIIDMFLFHDTNESALVFSPKYKEGERGYMKDHYKMLLHTLGDRYTRGLVLVAQLQHEGLLDNFEYDSNGKMSYNWSKDKRKSELKDHITKRNTQQERNNLPYDDHQINTLTSIAAKMFGAYTDEDKTRVSTNGVAQFAAQFKGYIIARSNELVQEGFDNTNISWYNVNADGKIQATTFYQEGILNTMILFAKEINWLKNSPISAYQNMRPEQQKNIMKMGVDLAFFASAYLLYALVRFGDDEEKLKEIRKSPVYMHLKFAWMDVVGIYNLSEYTAGITPASISYYSKLSDALWDFATFDFESGASKAWKSTGFGKSVNDVVGLIGND
jgi:hypothetical protein